MRAKRRPPGHLVIFARRLRALLLYLVGLGGVASALAAWLLYTEITGDLPSAQRLLEYHPPVATRILADDGTVVGEFYLEKRYLVPIERIPTFVRNAFLAAEDADFYRHSGFDPLGILRAFVTNTIAGSTVQGGSTITQQVVKSFLLSSRKSYERKFKELVLANRLERQLPKDQILYLYLNHIYFGSGAYGVAAAAQEYFGKEVDQLSVAEAALLAGLPQAPSRYSPFEHWPRAKARQLYVIERMRGEGMLTAEAADQAAREPLTLARRKGSFLAAPWYVEQVRRELEARYGQNAPYALGLRVETGLNLEMQAAADAAVRNGLRTVSAEHGLAPGIRHLSATEAAAVVARQRQALEGQALERGRVYDGVVAWAPRTGDRSRQAAARTARVRVGGHSGLLVDGDDEFAASRFRDGDLLRVRLAPEPVRAGEYRFVRQPESELQAALIAIDPKSGTVKAVVGGADFSASQFNRAVQGARQPGSAFKPVVYAAAIDHGFTPASVIVDEPISFRDHARTWRPHNFEERYFGPTTLRDALVYSRNVVTVKLANEIGTRSLATYVSRLGISPPPAPNLSMALGAYEVSLLELASAFSIFANQGKRSEPRFITRITDSLGKVLDEPSRAAAPKISPETAYIVTNMMQSVIDRGTGQRARLLGRPAAGKTGTTNDMRDAWFIGFTPQLLAGVWVGFDEQRSMGSGATGGHVAAPIWTAFMSEALADEPILDFPVPKDVSFALINPRTGQRLAPGSGIGFLECFVRGTEPEVVAAAPRRAPAPPVAPDRDVSALD